MSQPSLALAAPWGYEASSCGLLFPTTEKVELDFSCVSPRYYRDRDNILRTAAANEWVPEWDGSRWFGRLEPARANLLLWSSTYSDVIWAKSGSFVTADAIEGPIEGVLADKLYEDSNTSAHYITQNAVVPSAVVALHTFVKSSGDSRFVTVGTNGGGVGNAFVCFNPDTGLITETGAGLISSGVEPLANDWYKVSIVYDNTGGLISGILIGLSNIATPGVRALSYAGDGASGLYVGNSQAEQGAYPSSTIVTTTATVTRLASTSSTTGLGSRIGQSEGTIFFEGSVFDADGAGFGITISDGTFNNRVFIGKGTAITPVNLQVTVGGVSQVNVSGGNWADNTTLKIAIKYSANNFALWVNGVEVATDISGSTFTDGTLTRFGFDSSGLAPFYGNVKALAIYKTALSDAQLEQLTTP